MLYEVITPVAPLQELHRLVGEEGAPVGELRRIARQEVLGENPDVLPPVCLPAERACYS